MLGDAIGDIFLRDRAAWMLASEVAAVEDYWFDVRGDLFPKSYPKETVTIVWGSKSAHNTWFDKDKKNPNAAHTHGINFLPLTPGSLYLGRHPDYARRNHAGLLKSLSCFRAKKLQPLSVVGNKVLAGGRVASFAGISLFWSNNGWKGDRFYNADVISWLKSDWKSNTMGVEASGGYLDDRNGNKAKVKAVVEAAIANDMYVIIDWHTHKVDDVPYDDAIAFFQEMASTYGKNPHVIYEICNEPVGGESWSKTIKPYGEAVIAAIRAIDPNNLIIVGTPNWSQNVDEASRDPITRYYNIAYSLHFYADTHSSRKKAQFALDNGIALFVTEWGSVNYKGKGAVNETETRNWVDFMKKNDISNVTWAINDKVEAASFLLSGASVRGKWEADQLTASGRLARDIVRNWARIPQLGGGGGGGVAVVVPDDTDDEHENEVHFDDWADILWMQQATFDATAARKAWDKRRFAADFRPEYGNSLVFTEAWISCFEHFGPLQQQSALNLWPTYRLRQYDDDNDDNDADNSDNAGAGKNGKKQ